MKKATKEGFKRSEVRMSPYIKMEALGLDAYSFVMR